MIERRCLDGLTPEEDRIVRRRGVLPIAIVAKLDDVLHHRYAPWELAYDSVGQIMSRRHRYGQRPKWVVRHIRVDEPQDTLESATVPIDLRDGGWTEKYERERRARHEYVSAIAERIIRDEPQMVRLDVDFDLEREVLDELWRRWRAETADGFLLRALQEQR